ncbi:apolipoprotein C-II [Bombina bombina]|uniref:apolipoprotein C-II n=1 Tax=Bombina bombina TaxID=8345 RepID=UPI00235AAE8E|nr:apolipoprotein C-II [Bombina bombina]XP_053545952.1 apolipoprotein C-II [Bombina bombina]XP_053545953.1 apolipoprotein C-II [Bombina bombina]XP_053545954.1 apolipoprotein C-II [Bombina bombina]
MKSIQVIAICGLFLLLCTEIESYRIRKRETPTYVKQVEDFVVSSWEHVSSKTQELVENAKSTVPDTIKEYYDKGTSAVTTYTNILYDQVYHLLYPQ